MHISVLVVLILFGIAVVNGGHSYKKAKKDNYGYGKDDYKKDQKKSSYYGSDDYGKKKKNYGYGEDDYEDFDDYDYGSFLKKEYEYAYGDYEDYEDLDDYSEEGIGDIDDYLFGYLHLGQKHHKKKKEKEQQQHNIKKVPYSNKKEQHPKKKEIKKEPYPYKTYSKYLDNEDYYVYGDEGDYYYYGSYYPTAPSAPSAPAAPYGYVGSAVVVTALPDDTAVAAESVSGGAPQPDALEWTGDDYVNPAPEPQYST